MNNLPLRSLERQEYLGTSCAVPQINLDQTEGWHILGWVFKERTSHPIFSCWNMAPFYYMEWLMIPVFYPERKSEMGQSTSTVRSKRDEQRLEVVWRNRIALHRNNCTSDVSDTYFKAFLSLWVRFSWTKYFFLRGSKRRVLEKQIHGTVKLSNLGEPFVADDEGKDQKQRKTHIGWKIIKRSL